MTATIPTSYSCKQIIWILIIHIFQHFRQALWLYQIPLTADVSWYPLFSTLFWGNCSVHHTNLRPLCCFRWLSTFWIPNHLQLHMLPSKRITTRNEGAHHRVKCWRRGNASARAALLTLGHHRTLNAWCVLMFFSHFRVCALCTAGFPSLYNAI